MKKLADDSCPLVSIIIPAHNAEHTLGDTLQSALTSTYKNIEVLIVDDGSTDRTATIAADYVRLDDRIRLYRKTNGGPSSAFNFGFALARGDYVARLDADDLWHPSKLAKQIAIAIRHSEAALIYTFVRYIDATARIVCDADAQQFPQKALCRGLYESLIGVGSSALMQRSAVAEVGGCDESFLSWEDLLLQLRLCERHSIQFVPEYLVGYRLSSASLSSDTQNMVRTWLHARQHFKHLFRQVPARVHNWAHGKRCALFAESFAWRSRYGACAALLLQAAWFDPRWTYEFLRYRIGRLLKRRFLAQHDTNIYPPFLECRPDHALNLTDCGAVEGARLRRLEDKRVRLLAEIDEALVSWEAVTSTGLGPQQFTW